MSSRKKDSLTEKVLKNFRLVDAENQKYKCSIDDCKKNDLSGKKKSNLLNHARSQHKFFFDNLFGADNVEAFEILKKPLPYRRLKYIQTCVEIVAVNGNPFTKLNESGVRSLLQDEFNVLRLCGQAEGLGHPNYSAIKKHIKYLAGEIHKQIQFEVCGAFVAAMADSATKYDLSILGLSIQYMYEGLLKIRTIGMINMTEPQTALHLKNVIWDRLQAYEISKHQLISFVTDNANSMTAMVRLLNDEEANDIDIVDDDDDGSDSEDEDNDNGGMALPIFDMDIQNDEQQNDTISSDSESDDSDRLHEVNEILNENNDFDELLKELRKTFSVFTLNIHGIRCAAHTIQLAIQDALSKDDLKALLTACRKLCILLKKKKTKFLLRQNNIRIATPKLDSITRWNSKFRMLKGLLRCFDAVACLSRLMNKKYIKTVIENWSMIEEIVEILSIPSEATIATESATLTMSDLFGILLKMEFKLEKLHQKRNFQTDLATVLLEKLNERRKKLIENPAMKCAVFLDPRYIHELSSFDLKIAKYTLEKTHSTWKQNVEQQHDGTQNDSKDDSFEEALKAKRAKRTEIVKVPIDPINLTTLMEQYERDVPEMNYKQSILKYWEDRKSDDPVLHELACIINTIAPTQVTVERSFSILNLVYNSRRTSLDPMLLEQILLINLNKELVSYINKRDLEKVDNKISSL